MVARGRARSPYYCILYDQRPQHASKISACSWEPISSFFSRRQELQHHDVICRSMWAASFLAFFPNVGILLSSLQPSRVQAVWMLLDTPAAHPDPNEVHDEHKMRTQMKDTKSVIQKASKSWKKIVLFGVYLRGSPGSWWTLIHHAQFSRCQETNHLFASLCFSHGKTHTDSDSPYYPFIWTIHHLTFLYPSWCAQWCWLRFQSPTMLAAPPERNTGSAMAPLGWNGENQKFYKAERRTPAPAKYTCYLFPIYLLGVEIGLCFQLA